jgi:hypothetical protein
MNLIYILIILILIFVILYSINNIINNTYNPPFPIDIVYTWKGEKVSDNIRESYNYELKYSLRSIDLYAPWVNKIYILVDKPIRHPSWINKYNNKIVMVDTSETFGDSKYLPNSNSNAIETTIINIPNLSEHYIYFCDDIFLGRDTKYTDFFTYDGKAIVSENCLFTDDILINNNINSLNIKFPPSVNAFYPHVPIPQVKSVVKDFFNKYYDYIEWIKNTKTRNDKGCDVCEINLLNCPCQQIHYPICKYMYMKDMAVLTDYSNPSKRIFIRNNELYKYNPYISSLDILLFVRPLFFCINDDEKDPLKRIHVRKSMLNFFNNYYPNKASFEL